MQRTRLLLRLTLWVLRTGVVPETGGLRLEGPEMGNEMRMMTHEVSKCAGQAVSLQSSFVSLSLSSLHVVPVEFEASLRFGPQASHR